MGLVCNAWIVLYLPVPTCLLVLFYLCVLLFSKGRKVEGRKKQKMESGSAPAAIRLCGCPTWLPWNRSGRCAHPGHLTSGPASACTGSLHPDTATATTTVAAPGFALLLLPSLRILTSVLGLVVTVLPAVSVPIHWSSAHTSLVSYSARISPV